MTAKKPAVGERRVIAALLAWFRKVRRPMPWRLAPTPYACWLSEIMLQQTTYEQALPYYERFLKRFPSVEVLAAADEQDVLKQWEGLGYYARARNLLKAAKRIAAEGWPATREGWRALPGIGPYTAAALSSVLNGEPEPVVDGNVARVFARYWHLDDNFKDGAARERLAERLRPWIAASGHPGDFNQAMMELGALVCTPSREKVGGGGESRRGEGVRCAECPLRATCAARAAGDAAEYPKHAKKSPIPIRKATFIVVPDGKGRVLMVQNAADGLLGGLWELPAVQQLSGYAQTFSHFRLEAQVLGTDPAKMPRFVDPKTVPLTTAAKKILSASCGNGIMRWKRGAKR